MRLRIGTRGSPLALWQARTVAAGLEAAGRGQPEIVILKTSGDRLQEAVLSTAGGKRLFVKEIEEALLRRDVDLAVHSAKDLPADLPEGLTIAAVLPREDPRDAIVRPRRPEAPGVGQSKAEGSRTNAEVSAWRLLMGNSPRIGTGSVRRVAQLRALLPGARFEPVRGNIDTRLRKLDAGEYDALVLAGAGLRRLGLSGRISALLPIETCVPAPGQGAIAVEIRADDARARDALASQNDAATAAALDAERALVEALGGGCQIPLGAVALPLASNGDLELHAIVISPDGARSVRRTATGAAKHARDLGRRVADELLAAGAREILDEVRSR
jgi:hydroxymethylbilane synthase